MTLSTPVAAAMTIETRVLRRPFRTRSASIAERFELGSLLGRISAAMRDPSDLNCVDPHDLDQVVDAAGGRPFQARSVGQNPPMTPRG
jgi:hypothetical protein